MSKADKPQRGGPPRVSTGGGASLGQNPFGALGGLAGLPETPAKAAGTSSPGGATSASSGSGSAASGAAKPAAPAKNRGRVDIVRSTAGRGGKTVTVVQGFTGIGLPEKEALAKQMQRACGCGGTVKDGKIEIQGDNREKIAAILTSAGFRPVFAGG